MTTPWWQRALQALGVGLSKPGDALPDDAKRAMDEYTPEEIAEYHRTTHDAPPDAPEIDPDGI